MKLNVLQRILLFSVLPKEGTLLTMKTLKGLKEKVMFSEEDVKLYDIHQEDEQFRWDSSKDEPVEFDITEGEIKLVTAGLKELDSQGKITEQYLSLCELFNFE
jgi:hypothetical protein